MSDPIEEMKKAGWQMRYEGFHIKDEYASVPIRRAEYDFDFIVFIKPRPAPNAIVDFDKVVKASKDWGNGNTKDAFFGLISAIKKT